MFEMLTAAILQGYSVLWWLLLEAGSWRGSQIYRLRELLRVGTAGGCFLG
jgi:hypothetical protein